MIILNLIAFIVCFIFGIELIIKVAKSIKENKNDTFYLIGAIIEFVFAGTNLYLFITGLK